jgi:hypothetical protein
MSAQEENCTREEWVYLAKLFEKAERFPDMIECICKFVHMNPVLNGEERNILSAGYKNIICPHRSSWRIIQGIIKKEKVQEHIKWIEEAFGGKIPTLIENITDKLNECLDLLIKHADPESKAFYLKLRADYYRYNCELAQGAKFEKFVELAEENYKAAYELAEKHLPISNSTRLGIALNFSVFYYEIKNQKEEACNIAKNAFEEAMKVLDELEKVKAKDTLLIIQLLKENLILWSNEMGGDEE